MIRVLTGHTAGIGQLLAVGNSVFSVCHDNTARQWSSVTGGLIRIFAGHTGPVTGIAVRDNMLFTGSWDQSVRLWNLNNGNVIRIIPNALNAKIFTIAVAQNYLVVGGSDLTVRFWDWTNSSLLHSFQGFTSTVFSIVLQETQQGEIRMYVADYASVRQISLLTRQNVRFYPVSAAVCSLWVSGSSVFGGTCYYGPSQIIQWDSETGILVRKLAPSANSMVSYGSSLFIADVEATLKQVQIPELFSPSSSVSTIIDVRTSRVIIGTSVTSSLGEGTRANSNTSPLNSEIIIVIAASGVALVSVIIFSCVRYCCLKLRSPTMTNTPYTKTATDSNASLLDLGLRTTINNAGLTTAVTRTFEVSIPAFLELRWGLDFRQEQFITKGGTGSIYHAKCMDFELSERSHGEQLIVKYIAGALETIDEKTRTAFFQEIALTWRFRDHPNIVRLYGYSTHPVTMVMKWYELGDLIHFVLGRGASVARRIPYSKLIVVSLLRQFADAIAHLHKNGVAHCDIKPGNVLLDIDSNQNLVAILADFGISRIVDKESLKVQAFELADLRGASITYAGPEVIFRFRNRLNESSGKIWMAADTYAFAICILQMLVRRPPWIKGQG